MCNEILFNSKQSEQLEQSQQKSQEDLQNFLQDFEELHSKNRMALAFDFGFKKIGVAKGITNFKTVNPLAIIKSTQNKTNWQEIEKLVKTWKPNIFVVGIPIHNQKSSNQIAQATKGFAQKLFGKFGKTTYLVDESFSSLEAQSQLDSMEIDKGEFIDADAACVILDSFFNSHKNIFNKLDEKGWRLKNE